jgi:hypothetical protein
MVMRGVRLRCVGWALEVCALVEGFERGKKLTVRRPREMEPTNLSTVTDLGAILPVMDPL